ncbi:MAG TPA: lysine biosynthesis protein LysX [Nitrososphaerales archaeon]|nr:lysine biosynthesis protein LysX [Nitrososphaerales archaeon]
MLSSLSGPRSWRKKTGASDPTQSFSLLYDTIRWEEKAVVGAAGKRGIHANLVDSKDISLDVVSGKRPLDDVVVLQRCVSIFRNVHSTAALEAAGHRVVNSFSCAWVCGNKLFGTLELVKHKVPTPRTVLSMSEDSALRSAEVMGYPVVLKPIVGSWGRLSALLKDKDAARAVIEDREHMFPLYQIYYLQEFVKRPPRDIRSFVVGGKTVAAIYRYSGGSEWRTNTARGGRAEACKVTSELDELSLRAADAVGGEVVGVDLMEGEDGLLVHEVNNTTEFKNTVPATGVDIPGMIIDYLISVQKR